MKNTVNGNSNTQNMKSVNSISYSELELGGLNYIKQQRFYLYLSAIIPIISIIIQFINIFISLVFVLKLEEVFRPDNPRGTVLGGWFLLDSILPIFISFTFI